jgi:hypothetical protein
MRRLFWDIETSPNVVLSWNIGYNLSLQHDNIIKERAIICTGYKWEDEDQVNVLQWDRNQNDKSMLVAFRKVADQADELVAHNGDRFDLKWLRTRCLFHGLPPLPDYKTVDTLKIAWQKFRLNNAKLDYIAKYLGIEGKSPTGFGLWKRIVLDKDAAALKQMTDYCANDVRILQKVYERLRLWAKPKGHAGVAAGGEAWQCPHCGSTSVHKRKTRTTSGGAVQHQMQCHTCGGYYQISNTTFETYKERPCLKSKPRS